MDYSSLHENKKRGTSDFPIELYPVNSSSSRYEMPLHWHLEYELIHITSGSFELSLDGAIFPMNPGDCSWIGDGIVHGGTPDDCVYECIVFDLGTLLQGMPICTQSAGKFIASETGYTGVFPKDSIQAALSRKLLDAMERRQDGYEWTTVGLMWQLMGSLINAAPSSCVLSKNRKKALRLKKVLTYIKDHYENTVTLDELAAVSGMAPKYFCRAFSQMTGKTPIEYLNYYRIEQAGKLLAFTDNSVTEIALGCGFNDMSYFSKIFSRQKGMCPTAYRKQRSHFVYTSFRET